MFRKVMALCVMLPLPVLAQGMQTAFGASDQNTDAPIEVVADSLEVNDTANTAVFVGNVEIVQDKMRMIAPRVEVTYREDDAATPEVEDGIAKVLATGGVTMTSGEDAAEGETAEYNVESDYVILSGSVLLTQGRNVLSGNEARINLSDNTAQMTGRVRTIINPGSSQ